MPNIQLGPTGSLVTFPKLRWMGSAPTLPIQQTKQMQESTMSDGSRRYAVLGLKREWPFQSDALSAAELAALQALNVMTVPLDFVNNWESSTTYQVVIISFVATPLVDLYGGGDILYSVAMTIREI